MQPSGSADPPLRPTNLSRNARKWRYAAFGLLAALLVLIAAVLAPQFEGSKTESGTAVQWSYFILDSGPGVENNTTLIPAIHFCAPRDAATIPIFSMVWATSTGAPVKHVALLTQIPETPGHPTGQSVTLYLAENSSTGGTSFPTPIPGYCELNWVLGVDSFTLLTVYVVATLTFNYTTTVGPPSPF